MWQNLRRWGDVVQIPQGPWGVSQMGEAGAAHPRSLGGHTKLLPLQWAFWQGVLWTQISHRRSQIEARRSSHSVCPSTLSLLQWCRLCEVFACYPAAGHYSCTKRAHSKCQIRVKGAPFWVKFVHWAITIIIIYLFILLLAARKKRNSAAKD